MKKQNKFIPGYKLCQGTRGCHLFEYYESYEVVMETMSQRLELRKKGLIPHYKQIWKEEVFLKRCDCGRLTESKMDRCLRCQDLLEEARIDAKEYKKDNGEDYDEQERTD